MKEVILDITKRIHIDLERIERTICERGCEVSEAVREYVDRLDDSEHYLIGENEFNIILDALRNDGFED